MRHPMRYNKSVSAKPAATLICCPASVYIFYKPTTTLVMQRRIIATLSILLSGQLIAGDPPAKTTCDDGISASATIDAKLDSAFFHKLKTSFNWWIVESESGKIEDTTDGEIGPDDLVRIEQTASCTSTHQGEHLMEFCDAVREGDGIQLNLSGGLPAYDSSLSVTIQPDLAFLCDFSATYHSPTAPLRWKIIKKEFRLKSRDFSPGQRLYGWISIIFEETDGIGKPKSYKIEGYIKPVIQHKP